MAACGFVDAVVDQVSTHACWSPAGTGAGFPQCTACEWRMRLGCGWWVWGQVGTHACRSGWWTAAWLAVVGRKLKGCSAAAWHPVWEFCVVQLLGPMQPAGSHDTVTRLQTCFGAGGRFRRRLEAVCADNLHIRFGLCSTWGHGIPTAHAGHLMDHCSCHTNAARQGCCKAEDITVMAVAHVLAWFLFRRKPTCPCVGGVSAAATSGTREDKQHSIGAAGVRCRCQQQAVSRCHQIPFCSDRCNMHVGQRWHGRASVLCSRWRVVLHSCLMF